METRLLSPEDVPAVDRMLHDSRYASYESRLDRDVFILTGPLGCPTGVLVARPSAYVHEVIVKPSLAQATHVARLVQAAIKFTQGKKFPLLHAIFKVPEKNEAMLRFHEGLGSQLEEGKLMSYTFPQV